MITNPSRPPQERLDLLEGVAVALSPMHPKKWEEINEERQMLMEMGAQTRYPEYDQ